MGIVRKTEDKFVITLSSGDVEDILTNNAIQDVKACLSTHPNAVQLNRNDFESITFDVKQIPVTTTKAKTGTVKKPEMKFEVIITLLNPKLD